MATVFEGYEKQYCELSANLSKKCASANLLDGGLMQTLIQFGNYPFAFLFMHRSADILTFARCASIWASSGFTLSKLLNH